MTERRTAAIYIGSLSLLALGSTAIALGLAGIPAAPQFLWALVLVGLMVVAAAFPLPFSFKSKLTLETAVAFAAILMLESGLAMLVAASGTLIVYGALRRGDRDEVLFNSSQMALQTGAGALVLALAGWEPLSPRFDDPTVALAFVGAAAAMYASNIVLLGLAIGFLFGQQPRQVWGQLVVGFGPTESLWHAAQMVLGLQAAVIATLLPWLTPTLLLPLLTVYSSLGRQAELRRRTEEALLGTEAGLAETQRLARLGSWVWDLSTGQMLWSDEVYRILGYAPRSFAPSYQTFLANIHPSDRDRVDRILHGMFPDGSSGQFSFEHRVVLPDGEIRILHTRGELARDAGAQPERLTSTMHDITERKQLEEKLAHQAYHDVLTGLPNRTIFTHRLHQALEDARTSGAEVAVLFLDLDGFKRVNDSLGHGAGDELLRAVGERLRSCVRPGDLVARLAGDEFTVLLEGDTAADRAPHIAERIIDALHAPFTVAAQEASVGTSIGIAVAAGNESSADELMQDADAAMYRAKQGGKGRYEVAVGASTTSLLERV